MSAPVTNLSVMSFNIWVNGGSSLPRCIEAIRTSGVDLVGLQECNAATAQIIATNLGFHHLGASGVSIVSRFPIVQVIPTGGGSAVAVELGPGQRVYLFNCHLTAYPYGPYSIREGRDQAFVLQQEHQTRMPALNQLLATMAPHVAGGSPVFLTGDFNAPSHLDYLDYPWPTSVAPVQAGLVDSYRELHPANRLYPPAFAFDDPGVTWTPRTDQEPQGAYDRIDFLYYSPGDGAVPTQSVELDARNSVNPWPSDHRAVLTRFSLTPPQLSAAASQPLPANGASNVVAAPVLTWLAGSNAVSHDVYFGSGGAISFRTNTTSSSFAPGTLLPGTTYCWRVDERTPSNVVTGAVWSFTTRFVQAYEWNFSRGNLDPALGNGAMSYADGTITSNLVSFGVTDGIAVPHIGGHPASYLRLPAFTAPANGLHVAFTGSGPNGGGTYLNQFTMLWDVLLPGSVGWTPLFNTNPQNANDADFYIDPTGRLGIGAIGYSSAGLIAANTWYRIAFVADLAAGSVRYYLNGSQVFAGVASLDGRHSLYSNADAGPDLLLFNEGDAAGIYTHAALLGAFAFTDRALTAPEIAALGGSSDLGILVKTLPPLAVRRDAGTIQLQWEARPAVRLQKTINLGAANWQNVDGTLGAGSFTDAPTNATVFYRLAR